MYTSLPKTPQGNFHSSGKWPDTTHYPFPSPSKCSHLWGHCSGQSKEDAYALEINDPQSFCLLWEGQTTPSTANTTDRSPIAYNKLLNAQAVICHPRWYSRWPSGRTQLALFGLISKIHTPVPKLAQNKMESKVSLKEYSPKSRRVLSLKSKLNISKRHLVAKKKKIHLRMPHEELWKRWVKKIIFQFRVLSAKRLNTVQLNSKVDNTHQ